MKSHFKNANFGEEHIKLSGNNFRMINNKYFHVLFNKKKNCNVHYNYHNLKGYL